MNQNKKKGTVNNKPGGEQEPGESIPVFQAV